MNTYERYLYWLGFRHGKDFANSCHFPEAVLDKAMRVLDGKMLEPLTKEELATAIKQAGG